LSAIADVPNAKAKAQTADNKPLQHFYVVAFSDGKPDSTRDQSGARFS
jgi:hypothetical protein